jgi:probable O-glycosylation ligase (exosortase A-associated)
MNPHRYAWGAAYDFPFAKYVAIVTILGMLFTKDRMPLPKTKETILIILLGMYFTFTNYYAMNPEAAWFQWQKVMKIFVMTLVTMMLINDRQKLKYFIMVVAFSIGIIGIKGAIFTVVTGGEFIVFGPEGSFLGDNNDMALALNMTLPLLFFLSKDEKNHQLSMLLKFSFAMCFISTIFTYSRGGFLTLVAVSALLLLRSKYKIVATVIVFIGIIVASTYIPQEWYNRIESIKTYEESRSAMGRINAWWTAYYLAIDRPFTGGGFETFTYPAFVMYAPDPDDVHDAHSIYFEILGEHGFVALSIFLALIFITLFNTRKLKKIAADNANLRWIQIYSEMFQISLVAYMIGGIFQGRAYFDFFYHIVAMVVIMKVLLERELSQTPVIPGTEQKRVAGYKTNSVPS